MEIVEVSTIETRIFQCKSNSLKLQFGIFIWNNKFHFFFTCRKQLINVIYVRDTNSDVETHHCNRLTADQFAARIHPLTRR